MEPTTPDAHRRWLALALAGITDELRSVRVQVRALTALPPALRGDERALVALLLTQLVLLDRQCALLAAQAARLAAAADPRP